MPSKSDNVFTRIKENVMGTEEENRKAQADLDKQASEGSKAAKMLGGKSDKAAPDLTLEERKSMTAKAAAEAYDSDRSNWPLSPKKRAMVASDAADTVKKAKGGSVKSSASSRADGIAVKGKTRGKIC
jgi:hypothetical protein